MNGDSFSNLLKGIDAELEVYGPSFRSVDGLDIAMVRDGKSRFLAVASASVCAKASEFQGRETVVDGKHVRICPLDAVNATALRSLFPWTAPSRPSGHDVSIGCGDRLGLASPGQLDALRKYNAFPVLAQQSAREMKLTGRSFREVIDDACFLVFQAGYEGGFAADGDHLKSKDGIAAAIADGATMITLDLSEELVPDAASWSGDVLAAAFEKLSGEVRRRTLERYADKTLSAGKLSFSMTKEDAMRYAVMYAKAIAFAAEVSKLVGDSADLEISVDETTFQTAPAQHFYVASELVALGVRFMSLAPRFVGEFQKAIDYIGTASEFESDIASHVEIARGLGGYKISVHSGSDKFKIFPLVGKTTGGRFHLKTAGTSWLESLRAISIAGPSLFREFVKVAASGLKDALLLYHVSSDFSKIPSLDSLPDAKLPSLLEMDESRQMLHITYGAIFANPQAKARLYLTLHKEEALYRKLLCAHFERHLSMLGVPKRV